LIFLKVSWFLLERHIEITLRLFGFPVRVDSIEEGGWLLVKRKVDRLKSLPLSLLSRSLGWVEVVDVGRPEHIVLRRLPLHLGLGFGSLLVRSRDIVLYFKWGNTVFLKLWLVKVSGSLVLLYWRNALLF
jgi:hypothetical protein